MRFLIERKRVVPLPFAEVTIYFVQKLKQSVPCLVLERIFSHTFPLCGLTLTVDLYFVAKKSGRRKRESEDTEFDYSDISGNHICETAMRFEK